MITVRCVLETCENTTSGEGSPDEVAYQNEDWVTLVLPGPDEPNQYACCAEHGATWASQELMRRASKVTKDAGSTALKVHD